MKRDLDLVRLLLIDIENDSRGDGRNLFKLTPSFEGYAPEVVAYHFRMMVDGGLINGEVRHGGKISFRGVTYDCDPDSYWTAPPAEHLLTQAIE